MSSTTLRTARRIAALLVAVLLIWTVHRAAGRWSANAELQRAESLGAAMVRVGKIDPALLRREITRLERAQRRDPLDPRIPLAIGSYYLLLDLPAEAERWYRESLAVQPRPEALLNLARAAMRQGHHTEAEALYQRVVRLDPYRQPAIDQELAAWQAQGAKLEADKD